MTFISLFKSLIPSKKQQTLVFREGMLIRLRFLVLRAYKLLRKRCICHGDHMNVWLYGIYRLRPLVAVGNSVTQFAGSFKQSGENIIRGTNVLQC